MHAVDDGKVSILVLLDLNAAFDTVDHNILLSVLRDQFSIDNTAYNWFQLYLSDQQQSFVYNGQQTTFFQLDCSVPQGSVLGPLEFVAYTDDSSDVVAKHDINQHAYADDNLLHTSCFPRDVARAHQHLSECTADLVVWCAQRRLQLNANKTEVLPVGSKHNLTKRSNEDLSFTIGLETVQPSDAVRDLGVWLDSELSLRWDSERELFNDDIAHT